ncbi:MAG: hypothetical protein VR65_00445 [Desulfobulbaceae bacterium BRH_c16a]|nr:MAG: hypothetical protein VR65_00445 [Desulfobulbaceae bacterium BRH_c16a]
MMQSTASSHIDACNIIMGNKFGLHLILMPGGGNWVHSGYEKRGNIVPINTQEYQQWHKEQ